MKTIGVFAGSFNPFHKGHKDIVDQTKLIFDEVIVARGINPNKSTSYQESGHVKYTFSCLLTDYITKLEEENKDCNIILIRGIRDSKDLLYEEEQLFFLRQLKPDLKHVFILCNSEFRYISSSAIRTLQSFNKNLNYTL